MPLQARRSPSAGCAFLLLFLGACSDDPSRPVPSDPASVYRYPLDPGTEWTYAAAREVRFVDGAGTDVRPPLQQTGVAVRYIVAHETLAGRVWAVEEEQFIRTGTADTVLSWRRYRQDAGGLYRADLAAGIPPGAGPDSVSMALRLAYPPATGTVWALHAGDPRATGTVEAIDSLVTALGEIASWRVRYRLASDGPADRRHFWYSRLGVTRSEVYTQTAAVDVTTGDPIEIRSTESFELVGVRVPAAPGVTPKTARRVPVNRSAPRSCPTAIAPGVPLR